MLHPTFNIQHPKPKRDFPLNWQAMKVSSPEHIFAVKPLPPLEIVVRDLNQSDGAPLEWHGGDDLRSWYAAQWRNHCEETVRVLVADFNNFPIGQVAVHWHGKPTHPLVPDVQSLRVLGAFRGLGIGSLLLECAENVVRERGFAQISLSVALDNGRAHSLYERLGYSVFGEIYNDQWHYVNARGETCHVVEPVLDMVKNFDVGG